nr:hypothetical protein B0A51_05435 [Rachicladosporium sp. CCFEE 5018]
MAYTNPDLSGLRVEGREPSSRRKKLTGYLKAANEIRQSYMQGGQGDAREAGDQEHDSAFPDAAVVRNASSEMILFPSYARRHYKSKAVAATGPDGNDADYWRQTWDQNENDKAIVDIDVRGWIYAPQRGPTTRRQRLFIGLARQMCGLPAPPAASASADGSKVSSRASSPDRNSRMEEDLINMEAEKILQRGKAEAARAERGSYSENPNRHSYASSTHSRDTSPERGRQTSTGMRLNHPRTTSTIDNIQIAPIGKRSSWPPIGRMSAAELAQANAHLLARLRPFMSNPLEETAVTAFFYNETDARQRTIYTDSSGHFTCRAPLEFVPTHVRVFAGEGLSITEEVMVTPERGVSLISDIDDTIKHSGISAGAREIFRNAFIRDLGDMTIEGVREWYTTLHDMGVKMHYVSNSPWQMYPVLTTYFKSADLPRGSFHLKQYSGYLQGIFEPVAERKKATLDKLMRDFPDRKFILVGDSGEADLEVYTDVVIDNPGRIIGVFIRDVTTTTKTGYFDQSGSGAGASGSRSGGHSRNHSTDSLSTSKRLSRPNDTRDDDPELQAAIAASLAEMEAESRQDRRNINPDKPSNDRFAGNGRSRPHNGARAATATGSFRHSVASAPEEDLIDFSDAVTPTEPKLHATTSQSTLVARRSGAQADMPKSTPSPPPKPSTLRSPSANSQVTTPTETSKTPPPRPRKPSSAVKPQLPAIQALAQPSQPSPLSQVQRQDSTKSRPDLPTRPNTYRGIAKQKLNNVYNAMPSMPSAPHWHAEAPTSNSVETPRAISTHHPIEPWKSTAPPPPPRRVGSTQSFASIRNKQSDRLSSGGMSDDGLPGSPADGVGKKEFLWNQRWARAKGVMHRNGVTLRTWRVGSDVAHICVKLVEEELRVVEREGKATKGKGAEKG